MKPRRLLSPRVALLAVGVLLLWIGVAAVRIARAPAEPPLELITEPVDTAGSADSSVRSAPPPSEPTGRRLVAIVPMGRVPQPTVEAVADAVRDTLDVDTWVDRARAFPREAWYAPRKRWRAEKILEAVDADPPAGAWKVLVLTDQEISTTKDEHEDWGIGGLGTLAGTSCVVSTYLIRKNPKGGDEAKLTERIRKLAVHEFGHILGLEHCAQAGCVMADAQGKLISSLDASEESYCQSCAQRLP